MQPEVPHASRVPIAVYTNQTAVHANSQAHWLAALLGRVPMIETGRIGMKIAQITEGVSKSAVNGKEIGFQAGDVRRLR